MRRPKRKANPGYRTRVARPPQEPPNLSRVWFETPGQMSLLEGVSIGRWKWVREERGPTEPAAPEGTHRRSP